MVRYSVFLALVLLPTLTSANTAHAAPPVKPPETTPAKRPAPALQTLTVTPPQIALSGPYAESRVLVDGKMSDGSLRDLSGPAKFFIANPKLARVDDRGIVRPLKDGKTSLTVVYKTYRKQIPVVIAGTGKTAPPRFVTDVIPVLTRAGCNQGACHGANSGKGGFKLSLLGYDPDFDYESITRAGGARRVTPASPANSLLLRKPVLAVPHKGGKIFNPDSPLYRVLRDWVARGMPAPEKTEPEVVRLEVTPATRTLPIGETQRIRVRARLSDGSIRDVTAQTLFTASEESVATVSQSGEAKVKGSGEGAVVIRYRSLVATARLISPFAPPKPFRVVKYAKGQPRESQIDRLVRRKISALGLDASPRCTDAEFLRRASLDVIGLLPTPDEVRAFLADKDPKKREKLIDNLLDRPEYVDFWTLKWGDIFRSSRSVLTDKGMTSLNLWLRRSVAENKPWDKMAREILLAQGSPFEVGPANFYRSATNPETLAETTSQVFLGVRMQCAKCHNHPFERWTQNQYYEMAAFFARVRSKEGDRPGERNIILASGGEVNNPRTKNAALPTPLDAKPVPADYTGDRRLVLADWLTAKNNPFFAHVLVNRVWRHLMGRGLVEPVDDIRATNPPSNQELFDYLAKDFVNGGFDVKRLVRNIMLSETYQRSAIPTKGNALDTKYYSHYAFKRLGAEALFDAIATATGVPEKFNGYPLGTRAAQLPDTTVSSYFLDLFGRPARNLSCECERTDEPNLGQILHIMNSKGVNDRLASQEGRVAKLLAANLPDAKLVEELYLAAVSRFPTPEETKKAVKALTTLPPAPKIKPKPAAKPAEKPAEAKPVETKPEEAKPAETKPADAKPAETQAAEAEKAKAPEDPAVRLAEHRRRTAEDIFWALLNSSEFLFNH